MSKRLEKNKGSLITLTGMAVMTILIGISLYGWGLLAVDIKHGNA
ncbi:MAG: hypothetical protein Q4C20_09950 [Erysipelotrichaceae bacterium]|nr:hypothetical protein [Erysipelotrichaceae bacterium]